MGNLTDRRAKQIGLIVLQADETLERDMRHLLPAGLEYLVSRIPSDTVVTSDTLQAMETSLTKAAALLPRGAEFAAVGYGCTSGTAQIGAGSIAARIHDGVHTAAVTEPVSALIAACRALHVSRIALVSPYIASVSDTLVTVLADAGIEVVRFVSFDEPVEEKVVRIPPDRIMKAALDAGQDPDCQAVFLSCTNLRTLSVLAPLETALSKPVLSSNQVLAWHLCKIADVDVRPVNAGSIFQN